MLLFQTALGSGETGEVWSTYSAVSGFQFGIILAAGVNQSLPITPDMAGFTVEVVSGIFPSVIA